MLKAIEEQMKREKFEVMNFDDYCVLGNTVSRLRAELAKKSAEIERLKTVPMMYRRMAFNAQLQDENNELRQQVAEKDEVIAEAGEMLAMRDRQLAALKAELREICTALDDAACDLVPTAVECIKKLKAENESLKRDAERYRWLRNSEVGPSQIWELLSDDCQPPYMTLKAMHDLDAAIDAAMAQGEK